MSGDDGQPRCPECGSLIGMTSTYCIECDADLSDELAAADENEDFVWDQVQEAGHDTVTTDPDAARAGAADVGTGDAGATVDAGATGDAGTTESAGTATGRGPVGDTTRGSLLDPDGLVDDSLTVAVGIVAGIVAGLLTTFVLLVVTGSGWGLLAGVLAWLGVTAYLVRRRTVQGAVAKGGYAVAVTLLLVPFVALSPVVEIDGGIGERLGLFGVLLVFVAVPAGVAGIVGVAASRFVPESASGSEG